MGFNQRSTGFSTFGVNGRFIFFPAPADADLFMGNASIAYSKNGYGYAMEKADTTTGWSFPIFEEVFNQGYPHELKHFIECVQQDKQPLVTGDDGRAVLEIIYAAYASAGAGKKINLPFNPKVEKPVDLWINPIPLP